ncbi:MAG: hypothetical protein ABWZ25_05040 [Chitinophagaceae bacterium]
MKLFSRGIAVVCTTFILSLGSCSKDEEFITEPLTDYMLVTPGKYIIYRLDSTVTTDFGVELEVHSYQVKHQVDAEITDNLGQKSYRIYRSIRNADGTGDWQPNGTYMVTDKGTSVEVVEDNLRFLKLQAPIREGIEWKGNEHLPENPYAGLGFNIAVVDYMKNWDYYYSTFDPVIEVEGEIYNDVFTVEQEDLVDNWPVTAGVAAVNIRAYEQYAKNIGLVHRSHTILEYDPNSSGSTATFSGFAVEMWMIDHN